MKTIVTLALAAALLFAGSGCSNSQDAVAAANLVKQTEAAQAKADLANAAYYAAQAEDKLGTTAAPLVTAERKAVGDGSGCNVPNSADSEKFGLILNLNSLLCAKVVKVCPLKVGALEVTCIEYRGGSVTKTYIIDVKTASAFEQ